MSIEMRFSQHLEINQCMAQTAPACATDAQSTVANRHVLADICLAIKQQRQAHRLQHSIAIVEHNVPAREQLRQPAYRLRVGLQRHAARDYRVWCIKRVIVHEESWSVALHTPVKKDACLVDYNEPACDAQRETVVADHSVCGRLNHNRNCAFSGFDQTRQSGKINARRDKLCCMAREVARRSGRKRLAQRKQRRVEKRCRRRGGPYKWVNRRKRDPRLKIRTIQKRKTNKYARCRLSNSHNSRGSADKRATDRRSCSKRYAR